MFRAILFDLDGLLVDTEPVYWAVAREMARLRGRRVGDETLRRMMGVSRIESMRVLKADLGLVESPEMLLEEREEMMLRRYRAGVSPMPGASELVEEFRQRMLLAVVTSSPRKFVDVLLPSLGLSGVFDHIQSGEGVRRGKPDPEIYRLAMAALGVSPTQCIVLEDSRSGALAGRSSGAFVVAVPTELSRGDDFAFADAVAADLFEAARVIRGLPLAAQRSMTS